jgi:hypothetical protein
LESIEEQIKKQKRLGVKKIIRIFAIINIKKVPT